MNTKCSEALAVVPLEMERYSFPPLDILERESCSIESGDEYSHTAERIVREFRRQGIHVETKEIIPATRIITFIFGFKNNDFELARKIDDSTRVILEMALETTGISFQIPIPDSSYFAVQVPKKDESGSVRLARFVDAALENQMKIPCALGEDFRGNPRVIDLADNCHQLVGGQTGSGKSMFFKSLVLMVAMTQSPVDIRLCLIDCKGLDLCSFEAIPHVASPVITGNQEAISLLELLDLEMSRRQKILRGAGARDIWQYRNNFAENDFGSSEKLPVILVMIDEVQNLIAGKHIEIEPLLCKLVQMGRACGIIVILATQRPSVDILQGDIKANLPGRISFRLPTQADSRVVLGQRGAEILRGQGDLLAMENTLGPVQRFQAPLVTDNEIERICNYFSGDVGQPESNKVHHSIQLVEEERNEPIDVIERDLPINASTESDNQWNVTQFAAVKLNRDRIVEILEKRYSVIDINMDLVYIPFIRCKIRKNWVDQDILFEPEGKFFLLSGRPFRIIRFDESITKHIKKLAAIKLLIEGKDSIKADTLIEMIKQSPCNEIDENDLENLIENGLLSMNNHRFRVNQDYNCSPCFVESFKCDMIPEKSSSIFRGMVNIEDAIRYLRLHMAFLWGVIPHSFSLIGMPFYLNRFENGYEFMLSAWRKLSLFSGVETMIVNAGSLCSIAFDCKLKN